MTANTISSGGHSLIELQVPVIAFECLKELYPTDNVIEVIQAA